MSGRPRLPPSLSILRSSQPVVEPINTQSFDITQGESTLFVTDSAGSNSLLACFLADSGGCSPQGNSGNALFTMEQESGELFSLHSLDFEYFNQHTGGIPYFDPTQEYNDCVVVFGFQAGGDMLSMDLGDRTSSAGEFSCSYTGAVSAVLFDSDWSNLTRIEVFAATGRDLNTDGFAQFDNITVSIVPIPGAVWLFGSALAGLGWLRRKATA